jgi:chondroitin AC lyase
MRNPLFRFLWPLAALFSGAGLCLANSDLDRLHDQVEAFLAPDLDAGAPLAADSLNALAGAADSALARLDGNGRFTDIDLTTLNVWARDLQAHAERLLVLARAYRTPEQRHFGDPQVADAFMRATEALEALLSPGMAIPGNWWNWEIGIPKAYGPALFLMRHEVEASLMAEATESLAYLVKEEPSPWSVTGQNLIWVSFTRLYLGLLTGDTGLIDWTADRIASVCTVTTDEGIQPDGSFHQHGPSLQTGAYGAGVARDVGVFAYFARNTRWALDAEAIAIWLDYLVHGSRWAIYRNHYEPSARGREIVRHDSSGHDGALEALLLGASLEEDLERPLAASALHSLESWTKSVDPSYAMLAAQADATGMSPAGPVGVRAYPRSDYLLQRDDDWLLSLKMLSERTLAAERYNDEGKQSRHLSSGVTWLIKDGSEWDRDGVRASLDWARLPGTTTEIGLDLSKGYPNGSCYGHRSFVGGLDAGSAGVAAMDWLAREHEGDSHLLARKSWFFWTGGHVAIGSGITSRSGLPVETTAAQWPLSDIASPVQLNGTALPIGRWSEPVTGPALVEADGIGYWIAPEETARLSRDYQSGRFREITRSGDTVHTNLFMGLGFEHGSSPVNEEYAYAVMPEYPGGADESEFEILSRDNAVHAVRFPEENRLSAVFWESGQAGYLAARQRMLVSARQPETGRLLVTLSAASHGQGYLEILLGGTVHPGSLPEGVEIREMASAEIPVSLLRIPVADGEEARLDLEVAELSDFAEIAPILTGSRMGSGTDSIRLNFTRPVDPGRAADPSSYRIFPAASIERAEPSADGRSVELFLKGILPGRTYRALAVDMPARDDPGAVAPLTWCAFSLPGGSSSSQNLLPEADAHVRDGQYAGDNFGKAETLYVKLDGEGYQREAFLRFDLREIREPVQDARLRLMVENIGPLDSQDHEILTTTDSWEEASITWTTRPSAVAYHSRYTLSGDALGIRLDVTGPVNAHLGRELTFVIRAAENTGPDGWTAYASRENSAARNRPQLTLQTSSVQESWLQAFFGEPAPDPGEDSDRDGFSNLLEYALGLNPTDPDAGSVFQTGLFPEDPTAPFLPHPVPGMPGVDLQIEFSPDLLNWEPASGSPMTLHGIPGTLLPGEAEREGFFRVIVFPEE